MRKILTNALFPTKCLVCGSFYHIDHHCLQDNPIVFDKLISLFVCPSCSADYVQVEAPICIQCGIMFPNRDDDNHLCEDCIRFPKKFKTARASGIYDQSFMALIHALKYRGSIQLAKPMGLLLLATLFRYWTYNDFDLIIPVPLHKKRFRQRGFNQVFLLIRNWLNDAEQFGTDLSSITVNRDVLKRHWPTKPQTGLRRQERMKNIQNAFSVSDPDKVAGKKILLVDDVYTTGATANECARVLLKNKADQVDVLTLARAM